ncbi:ATP-binding protein [Streptomyces gamaensis]|uniref:ATP-binding protein n=1 Tax=Streptomyces gamaensis TaxID=1763542 RepID=A0ABW0ZEJ5_9ACTN
MATASATLSTPPITCDNGTAESYRMIAPATRTTARVARAFVTAVLEAEGMPALVDDACVCVSDVVSNVVQHARVNTMAVDVNVGEEGVVVGVRDGDTRRWPRRREPRPEDEAGRGLALVRRLSDASGVALTWDGLDVVGKCVWFSLDQQPRPQLRAVPAQG